MKISPEIILALDVDDFLKAKKIVNKLSGKIKFFKVGLQLFTSSGPKIIEFIRGKKARIFLDLKFCDIPNTVANAARQSVRLKVNLLTLHISGGEEMLVAAVKAADEESKKLKIKRPLLVGVTVLTSQEAKPGEVLRLARLGIACGLDGVVCSVREAGLLRQKIKKQFVIVTPGIRPSDSEKHDQKRVATVSDAVKAGSSFLVVGRPILEAKDPLQVAAQMVAACNKI